MTGVAIYLIQEIINNAFIDLDTHNQQRSKDSAAYPRASEEAVQQAPKRKRKHPTTPGSSSNQSDLGGLEVDRSQNLTPIAVRIAALEALEALLTVVFFFCSLPESLASSEYLAAEINYAIPVPSYLGSVILLS